MKNVFLCGEARVGLRSLVPRHSFNPPGKVLGPAQRQLLHKSKLAAHKRTLTYYIALERKCRVVMLRREGRAITFPADRQTGTNVFNFLLKTNGRPYLIICRIKKDWTPEQWHGQQNVSVVQVLRSVMSTRTTLKRVQEDFGKSSKRNRKDSE